MRWLYSQPAYLIILGAERLDLLKVPASEPGDAFLRSRGSAAAVCRRRGVRQGVPRVCTRVYGGWERDPPTIHQYVVNVADPNRDLSLLLNAYATRGQAPLVFVSGINLLMR